MIASGNDMRVAGIRRAAILVASLDQAAADLLLDQLDPQCADLVRRASAEIDTITAEQRRRIIEDFRHIQTMVPGQSPAGIDLEGPVAEMLSAAPRELSLAARPPAVGAGQDESLPFGFLHEAEEKTLARLLSGERPQAIALVLSHLPPRQAGEALARLRLRCRRR